MNHDLLKNDLHILMKDHGITDAILAFTYTDKEDKDTMLMGTITEANIYSPFFEGIKRLKRILITSNFWSNEKSTGAD